MKKIFRKAITVLTSTALIGATVGMAAAASYPEPFTSNTAIVVGANAAPSDTTAAGLVKSNLNAANSGSSSTTLTGAEGVTEDEVVLGEVINASGYKVQTTMTDSKIPSLIDKTISWDDGVSSEDYDVHEEIKVIGGGMSVLTSFDDEELTGVALSNNAAASYRYVFDETFPISRVGMDNTTGTADTLYLTILGKRYEISAMTSTSITVITSEQIALNIGESTTVDGKTFTVEDVYSDKAKINGEIINEGSSKKIDGIQVEIETVGYHSNSPEASNVIIRVGKDISKTYSDGDEYIGENEDDPLWAWDLSNLGSADGYIGIKYNVKINDADDNNAGDSIKYAGEGYIFPENFAEIRLDSLSDVSYEDITVEFTTKDLYNESETTASIENANVIVISGETTSTITVGSEETDTIYVYYADDDEGTYANAANGSIEVFYRNHDGGLTPTNRARYETKFDLGVTSNLTEVEIATIDVGDTTLSITATVVAGDMTLSFSNPSTATGVSAYDIDLNISGTTLSDTAGTFERLGATVDADDTNDIMVRGTDVSTKEESIMNYYGVIVAKDDTNGVEGNADEDQVILSVPSDQVFAQVSVVAGGEASTTGGEAGVMTVTDTQVSTVAGKNLVVIGGSAINSVAAELLEGAFSEGAFTTKTGIAAGQFLIESFPRAGKTALLVAGYNAPDTEKAVTYLLNNDIDTTEGKKYKGTSATSATLVVA